MKTVFLFSYIPLLMIIPMGLLFRAWEERKKFINDGE